MRVVDTSLWIELIVKGPLLEQAKAVVTPLATCLVPAMVHYELVKWCQRKLSEEDSKSVISLLTECMPVEMDVAIATEAARLSILHKLHATDAIIYATAQLSDAKLFTCDAHFKELPGVEYFEK
jgi:predicted nucleic acid-binding protein